MINFRLFIDVKLQQYTHKMWTSVNARQVTVSWCYKTRRAAEKRICYVVLSWHCLILASAACINLLKFDWFFLPVSPNWDPIQSRKQEVLVYAPGYPGAAQPTPKLTIPEITRKKMIGCVIKSDQKEGNLPTHSYLDWPFSSLMFIKGPPESPWHESWAETF